MNKTRTTNMQKCYSKQGQAFRTEARNLQIEILESPWLHELMAFYINLRRSDNVAMELLGELSLTFDEDKPTLSCGVFDSLRIDIDLTCSICLVRHLYNHSGLITQKFRLLKELNEMLKQYSASAGYSV
jgi:hypothetical protein